MTGDKPRFNPCGEKIRDQRHGWEAGVPDRLRLAGRADGVEHQAVWGAAALQTLKNAVLDGNQSGVQAEEGSGNAKGVFHGDIM